MLDQLKLLEALGAAPLMAVVVAAAVLGWRWLVYQDRRIDDARAQRWETSSAQIRELELSVGAVGRQLAGCATQGELRRVEGELGMLQSDVRAELAQVRGALDVLATRVEGQGDILVRIDDHLRGREAT